MLQQLLALSGFYSRQGRGVIVFCGTSTLTPGLENLELCQKVDSFGYIVVAIVADNMGLPSTNLK